MFDGLKSHRPSITSRSISLPMAHYLIRLLDNAGKTLDEVQDIDGLIDGFIIPLAEQINGLCRHIDPHGTTTFNGLQCEAILPELSSLDSKPLVSTQKRALDEIRGLLMRAISDVHMHVCFFGD
jgi:hypothetical protein